MAINTNTRLYFPGNEQCCFQNELDFSSELQKEIKTISEQIDEKSQQLLPPEYKFPTLLYAEKNQKEHNKLIERQKELEKTILTLNGSYYQDPNSVLHQRHERILKKEPEAQFAFDMMLRFRDDSQRDLESIKIKIKLNENTQEKFLRLREIDNLLHSLNTSLDIEWKVAQETGNTTAYDKLFDRLTQLEEEKSWIISDLQPHFPQVRSKPIIPEEKKTEEIKTLESQKQEKVKLLNLHAELLSWAMEIIDDKTCEFLVRLFNIGNIYNCFKDNGNKLQIDNWSWRGVNDTRNPPLTALSPVINAISKFNHFKTLSLIAGISMLPPEIKQCTQLKRLNLNGNRQLQFLPPEIGNLINLTSLDTIGNKIEALPPQIKYLTNLIKLRVIHNNIRAVPPEIKYLQNLTELNLGFNYIQTLPPEIGQLTKLKDLNIPSNPISILPIEIGQLINLESLSMQNMHLQTLPPEIGLLTKLDYLFFMRNDLQGIPAYLARLSSHCIIRADENHLSLEAIQTFRAQIAHQRELNSNLGPQFEFSIHDNNNTALSDESTIGEMISFWLNQFKTNFSSDNVNCNGLEGLMICKNPIGDPLFQPFFDKLTARQIENLKKFLLRLKSTDDFKHPLTCQGLVLDVARMLHGACTNEAFREKLFLILETALETCHDRVADAFNDIYLLWCLYCQAKDLSPKKLAELLIGGRRLDIVNRFARVKIKEKSLGDQIEVFLYFKTKLKHVLKLPVSTEGMLYPKMAGITDEELESATALALDQTSSSEQVFEILMSSDHWREKLKQENPAEFKKIDAEIFVLLEQLAEDTTLNSAQSKKKNDEIMAMRKEKIKQLEIELTKNWIATSGILPQ